MKSFPFMTQPGLMIKRYKFLLVLPFIFQVRSFAWAEVTVPTNGPRLVWQKNFKDEIMSVAISRDGQRIVVADKAGFLQYFDADGKELWRYKYTGGLGNVQKLKTSKPLSIMTHIVMSDDGKYIACTLEGLLAWKQGVIDTETLQSSTEEFEAYTPQGILYFDNAGKLLWEFKAKGYPAIPSDGKFVFIVPDAVEDGKPRDKYYFLNQDGKLLWTEQSIRAPAGGISDDGLFVFTKNAVFDVQHKSLWKLGEGERFEGIAHKLFVTVKSSQLELGKIQPELRLYKNNKYLWGKVLEARNLYPDEVALTSMIDLFSASPKYFATRIGGKILIFNSEKGNVLWEQPFSNTIRLECIQFGGDERYLLIGDYKQLIFYETSKLQKWILRFSDLVKYILPSKNLNSIAIVFKNRIAFYDNSEHL